MIKSNANGQWMEDLELNFAPASPRQSMNTQTLHFLIPVSTLLLVCVCLSPSSVVFRNAAELASSHVAFHYQHLINEALKCYSGLRQVVWGTEEVGLYTLIALIILLVSSFNWSVRFAPSVTAFEPFLPKRARYYPSLLVHFQHWFKLLCIKKWGKTSVRGRSECWIVQFFTPLPL